MRQISKIQRHPPHHSRQQSGNPAGRPLGARHKITEAIIQDISGAWQTQGPQVLNRLAVEDPATFAKLAVGPVPKDVLLSINAKLPAAWTLTTGSWSRRLWAQSNNQSRMPIRASL